jgi:acylaminoacyl-peptidase
VGRHQPVVVVCEVKPGAQPSLLTGIPPKVSPGQLAWTPDGNALLGVAWENDPRRLGLVYCTNRLSHIFLLSLDGGYSKYIQTVP